MSIKIGNAVLEYGLMLAPMAGVTDRASRKICRECGAEYTVTEMVSAKAIHYNDAESLKLAAVYPDELPCAVQIFGHEPDIIAEAVEKICASGTGPTAIDINMGCPMKKIVSNGDGSALMKSPELAGEIIKAAVSVSSVPVTVKFRTGWNAETKNAVRMAEAAEKNGAALVCVHGRTREEMYAPPVDRGAIAEVKRAVSLPVIANGGIFTADDALFMLDRTGSSNENSSPSSFRQQTKSKPSFFGADGAAIHSPFSAIRAGTTLPPSLSKYTATLIVSHFATSVKDSKTGSEKSKGSSSSCLYQPANALYPFCGASGREAQPPLSNV